MNRVICRLTRREKADRDAIRPSVLMIALGLALAIIATAWRAPAYGSGIDSVAGTRAAVIWAVGDGDGSAASAMVTKLVSRGKPARFLYLGDVYEYGTASDYASNYAPTFGRWPRSPPRRGATTSGLCTPRATTSIGAISPGAASRPTTGSRLAAGRS